MLWLTDVYSLWFLYRVMVEGEGGGVYFYFLSISYSASNIGLCVSIYVSLICRFSLLVLYIWYLSNVFRCLPFLPVVITSIVSVVTLYECPIFNMWFRYPELLLLLLISCVCSLYLVLNVLPVCPNEVHGLSNEIDWTLKRFNKQRQCNKSNTVHIIIH
jgi:hypothetical protein